MRAETTQLDRRPVSLQVRDLMRKSILSGQFRPGDQLPTEAEFAEEYGVSRTSIREALKLLEQEGCIVVRRGRGRFASPSVHWSLQRRSPCSAASPITSRAPATR